MIERIIHQIWHPYSAAEMPVDWQRFSRTWAHFNPDFEHRLWGPQESRNFVAAQYPGFLPTYDGYQRPVQRVDSLRVMLLHHFGGVYVDLDVECLQPIDPLLAHRQIVIPAEPDLHAQHWRARGYPFDQVLSTAFLASERRHPFWATVLEELARSAHLPEVMDSTGPFVVTRCFAKDPDRGAMTVAPPETIYPVDGAACESGAAYDLEAWVRATHGSYAVHHWASTWNRPGASHRPARRPYDQGLPVKLLHPALRGARTGQLFDEGELVSCLMVSRGWADPARWAIECFRRQSYESRELVIVTTNGDGDLGAYVKALGDPLIRVAAVLPHGTPLGAQRNAAVESAKGELVCAWDDDDLCGPDRLAAGITAMVTGSAAAAVLERVCLWWPARRQLAISSRRAWEGTLVARRKVLPRYLGVNRDEGARLLDELAGRFPVAMLDDPNLYVHVAWGGHASGAERFEKLLQAATFRAEGADYERALSVVQKHVPALEYFGRLAERDPKTYGSERQDLTAAPPVAGGQLPAPAPVPPSYRLKRGRAVGAVPPARERRRFLFAWEIGGGIGHTVPLAQVAGPLLEAGHEVHLALLDLSSSRAALGALAGHPGLRVWQAPHWQAALQGRPEPASHAELLFHAGYLDHRRLAGLVDGWDTLLAAIEPDLLLVDNAPTALLAARGRPLKRALLGTGFFLPIPEAPMPSFREWEGISKARLESAEELVLGACNAILAERRRPLLAQFRDLFECDERFLITVPELDHFERRAREGGQHYCGSLAPASQGQPANWPSGTEPAVFAYLKGEYPRLMDVLKALRAGPWRALAYVPGLTRQLTAELANERLAIAATPIDMSEVCRTADAVVCQAGSGTVATALHAGKPVVMLPMHVEQFLVARRVRQMGAGLYLLEDGIGRFGETLGRVLAEPLFRENASAFARRHAGTSGEAVVRSIAARCAELADEALAERERAY